MNVLSFSFLIFIFLSFCTNHASLEIVAGLFHNCVYEPGQTGMMCWGYNVYGQLGYGDTNNRGDNPGEMSANLSIVALGPDFNVNTTSLGGYHSCATSEEHAVKCWGQGDRYQTGHATTNDLGDGAGEMGVNLAIVEFLADFVPLKVAGGYQSCVLSTDALLVCFGWNNYGQCGAGTSDSYIIGPPSSIAVVDLGSNFTPIDIAAFRYHVCALSQQQSIKCFGYNNYGSLGYGDTTHRGLTPQSMGNGLLVVGLGSNFIPKAVETGAYHTCALSTLKTVKCFGENIYGQCGQVTPGGTNNNIGDEANEMDDFLPVIVFPDGFVPMQMALGLQHTCILSESGQVACFGRNDYGQLGLGHTSSTTSPTLVDLGTDFIPRKITAGAHHTCAVSTVDTVKCWGRNQYGQLGLGHANNMGDQANEMGDDLQVVDVLFAAAPTTAAPTTDEPTGAPTAAPTTAEPTTDAPTTPAPTTMLTTAATATATEFRVTIEFRSASCADILVTVSDALDASLAQVTVDEEACEDDDDVGEEGSDATTTATLLVAIADVQLDTDVIQSTLREAMVQEYGEDIVEVRVEEEEEEEDAQSHAVVTTMNMVAGGLIGAFLCGICVGAFCWYDRRRTRRRHVQQLAVVVAQQQPKPQPPHMPQRGVPNAAAQHQEVEMVPGAVAEPGAYHDNADVDDEKENKDDVRVNNAGDDDGDENAAANVDERKQGEEDVELEMAGQEEAKEGARALLVRATAGVVAEENEDNRTPGDTMGATVGNDPNLGVYELNQMVDL